MTTKHTDNESQKIRTDEHGKPIADKKSKEVVPHHGEQPVGNGANGKPAAFPPHN